MENGILKMRGIHENLMCTASQFH